MSRRSSELAALSPAIAANIDPSHFMWMRMDSNRVVQRLAGRIGHAHGKDVVFNAEKLALNGLLDHRWPAPATEMPWNFATVGRGHGLPWWQALVDGPRGCRKGEEHRDRARRPVRARHGRHHGGGPPSRRGPRQSGNEEGEIMSVVRAAVTERPGVIALRDFPMPDPAPGAVVMKVRYSGICGTDKHTFRGESKQYAGTPARARI